MVKAAAVLMKTGSASALADGTTVTAMNIQCLKVDVYFLWHGNPSLQ